MSSSLFAAGLACLAAGGLIDLFFGTASRRVRSLPYLLGLAASGCLFALGIHATTTSPVTVDLSLVLGVDHGALRIDPLAGLFLTLLFAIAMAVSVCFVS